MNPSGPYPPPNGHAPIGVLLSNLGTPDAPTAPALRRYLAEFLWDRRVVDLPRPLWWLILHGIILRTRPRRSAAAYRRVWTEDGSPLMSISTAQCQRVRERLEQLAPGRFLVALGMRYGNPSIAHGLQQLLDSGVERVLVLPLYPQYCSATTASTVDAVAAALATRRFVPELRFVADYHRDSGYIAALAASVREHRQGRGDAGLLLFSFHGTPQRFRDEGDPYYHQCQATAAAVAQRLGLEDGQWRVSFQSRFGKETWLQPYTDETLKQLGAAGVGTVDVLCPGFSADCLETIEEIGEENRAYFQQAGGVDYYYIPALNDRPDHIGALADLVRAYCSDWPVRP